MSAEWIDLHSALLAWDQFITQCQEKGRRAEILTITYVQSGDASSISTFYFK